MTRSSCILMSAASAMLLLGSHARAATRPAREHRTVLIDFGRTDAPVIKDQQGRLWNSIYGPGAIKLKDSEGKPVSLKAMVRITGNVTAAPAWKGATPDDRPLQNLARQGLLPPNDVLTTSMLIAPGGKLELVLDGLDDNTCYDFELLCVSPGYRQIFDIELASALKLKRKHMTWNVTSVVYWMRGYRPRNGRMVLHLRNPRDNPPERPVRWSALRVYFDTPKSDRLEANPPQEELLKRSYSKPAPNYLQLVKRYADTMIRRGRDRYGEVRSPLFASTLTRGDRIELLPYPAFIPMSRPFKPLPPPGERTGYENYFHLAHFANMPSLTQLGAEDAHKQTVVGEDLLDNVGLYRALFELTRLTGNGRYKQEAEEAIDWWFKNTQNARSGLYPWGEHLGWDFRNDNPSYFTGPYTVLFSRIFHEPRANKFELWGYLAQLPAQKEGEHTPLEKYAMGCLKWHFWDVKKAYFDRHGDYCGQVKPQGNGGFPRILAWCFDVWTYALARSKNPGFKKEMAEALEQVLDGTIARLTPQGYLPFIIHAGRDKDKPPFYHGRTNVLLAAKAWAGAQRLKKVLPALAARLGAFADGLFNVYVSRVTSGSYSEYEVATVRAVCEMSGRKDIRQVFLRGASELLGDDITQIGLEPKRYSMYILSLLKAYESSGDRKFLKDAERQGRLGVELFLDDDCPLPKVCSVPIYLHTGSEYPVFYHAHLGCDDLMCALLLLSEALNPKP